MGRLYVMHGGKDRYIKGFGCKARKMGTSWKTSAQMGGLC